MEFSKKETGALNTSDQQESALNDVDVKRSSLLANQSNLNDVTVVPTSVPMYLFASNPSEDLTEEGVFSVTAGDISDLQFKSQDSVPENLAASDSSKMLLLQNFSNVIGLPLSYYNSVSTAHSTDTTLMSMVEGSGLQESRTLDSVVTAEKSEQQESSELSEEMIRSFVVGGNRLSKSAKRDKVAEKSTGTSPYTVTAIISTDGAESCRNAEDDFKNQVIIVTEDEQNSDIKQLIVDDSAKKMEGPPDLITSMLQVEMESSDTDNDEIMIQLLSNENNSLVQPANLTGFSSAEDILNQQPVLDLDFEVVAQIENMDGVLLGREITTQTKPVRKLTRKRKSEKVESSHKDSKVMKLNEEKPATATDQFKCHRCGLKLQNEKVHSIHVRCHTNMEKGYQCYHCDFAHKQWIKMYHHLFSHGIEKPFKCTECEFSCANKSDLTAHTFVHSSKKQWICIKCDRSFKHRRNMVAHLRLCPGLDESGKVKKAENQVKFICNVCQKVLSNKRNLDKHMEIHMDFKPYICDLCGHTTRLKESFILHKRLHTGEKPFKCDQCDYSTPDKSSLRRHKRRHSNEKPYSCSFCQYKSIQKHCLDNHIRRKHTGEQFVCGLCHYMTHDRYGLNQHFKQHQGSGLEDGDPSLVSVSSRDMLETVQEEPKADVFIQIQPKPSPEKSTEQDKNWDSSVGENSESTSYTTNLSTTLNITQEQLNQSTEKTLIDLNGPEGTILQQIQQPGDLVFVQDNGDIVIKKPDGRILIIQQQSDTQNPTALES